MTRASNLLVNTVLFINVTNGCQNVAFLNFPICHVFGLFLSCYEHSELLVSPKSPKCHIIGVNTFLKYSITDILFICVFIFLWFFTNYYAAMQLVIFLYLPSIMKIFFMGDQFLYLFIKFSIIYLLNS